MKWLGQPHTPSPRPSGARHVLFLLSALVLVGGISLTVWQVATKPKIVLEQVLPEGDITSSVEQASFSARTAEGDPYQIEAARVEQIDPASQNARLTEPKALLHDAQQGGQAPLSIESSTADYDHGAQTLDLQGKVRLERAGAFVFETDNAKVDLAGETASSDTPVTGTTSDGATLNAEGFTLEQGGQMLRFEGPATLVLPAKTGQDQTE